MSYATAHPLAPLIRTPSRSPAVPAVYAACILAVATLLHLVNLTRFDIGTDEAHSFLTATAPRGILFELQNDTNSPLYFFILKAWIAVAGTSLAALRLPSVLFGVAAVAGLGAVARECGASGKTIAWTLLLAAFNPVQLHYVQLARGYTLAGFLLIMALWTFVRAIKTGRANVWALHGLIVVAGAWTHALFVPIAAGFFVAALGLRITRRQLAAMAITYGVAAIFIWPVAALALHQAEFSGGTAWLRDYWLATPPAAAIPKSLALLALGGDMPRYLLQLPLPVALRALALLLTALAAAAFFWPRRARRNPSDPSESIECRRWRPLWVIFTLWPLVFVWCYSAFFTPIYLVGRYDLFAQPAYLILLATGFSRLQNAAAHPLVRWVLPALVSLVLAAGIAARWSFPLDPQIFHHEDRIAYFTSQLRPNDSIVCTGLEASPTLYWLHERHLDIPLATVPAETLDHPGWLISDAEIIARRDQWPAEIVRVLNGNASGRVWIFLDGTAWTPSEVFAPSPREELALSVLPTALAHGWRLAATDPAQRSAEARLRMVSLIRDSLPESAAATPK